MSQVSSLGPGFINSPPRASVPPAEGLSFLCGSTWHIVAVAALSERSLNPEQSREVGSFQSLAFENSFSYQRRAELPGSGTGSEEHSHPTSGWAQVGSTD